MNKETFSADFAGLIYVVSSVQDTKEIWVLHAEGPYAIYTVLRMNAY
jgi:hypothetical protein